MSDPNDEAAWDTDIIKQAVDAACIFKDAQHRDQVARLEAELAANKDDVKHWTNLTMEYFQERDALAARVGVLEGDNARLREAIAWADGLRPGFNPPEDCNRRKYWWRDELLERAGLTSAALSADKKEGG